MKRLPLFFLTAAWLAAQGLTPQQIHQLLAGNAWPTYSGDYSGKRYSSLTQLNQSNVTHLTLAWTMRITPARRPVTRSSAARPMGR